MYMTVYMTDLYAMTVGLLSTLPWLPYTREATTCGSDDSHGTVRNASATRVAAQAARFRPMPISNASERPHHGAHRADAAQKDGRKWAWEREAQIHQVGDGLARVEAAAARSGLAFVPRTIRSRD